MANKIIAILCALCLAGCATMPQNIKPQFVAQSDYNGLSCDAARSTSADIRKQLVSLNEEQTHAAIMGAVWLNVGLWIAWPALFGMIPAKSHDHKDEIARLKGEDAALIQQMTECG